MDEPRVEQAITEQNTLEQVGATSAFERRHVIDENTSFTDFIPLPGRQLPNGQLFYLNLKHARANQRIEYASFLFTKTDQGLVPIGHLDYFLPSPEANPNPRLVAITGIIDSIIEDIQKSGSVVPDWLTGAASSFRAQKGNVDAMHIVESEGRAQLRGQQLGKTLMLLTLAQAEADGFKKLYIQGISHGAEPFYERLGSKKERVPHQLFGSAEYVYLDTHLKPEHTSFFMQALTPPTQAT